MAEDILKTIIADKVIEVAGQRDVLPISRLEAMIQDRYDHGCPKLSMSDSLRKSDSGIIAEFKRRSPSKGWIKEDGSADVIPSGYSRAGASAVSILADEKYFGGSPDFIAKARASVSCPILYKEFVIDEYQLYKAASVGADAVLLIAAAIDVDLCRALAAKAHKLGLETLLEVHQESELDHLSENIDMVGVNNRCLGTFHTDVETSFRMAAKLPAGITLVSESGISNPQTVRQLREIGYRGFLIGETFMKTPDPAAALSDFIKAVVS